MQRTACQQDEFNFDDWARLAARDPSAFEARRAELIEEVIRSAPRERQERLRRLQWRVDRTRDLAANPVAACVRISQMMWDSLLGEHGLLPALEAARDGDCEPRHKAPVLTLPARPRAHDERH